MEALTKVLIKHLKNFQISIKLKKFFCMKKVIFLKKYKKKIIKN